MLEQIHKEGDKELVEELVVPFDNQQIYNAISLDNKETVIQASLERLGRLPNNFNGQVLLPLLNHPSSSIRLLAVKNLGKMKDATFLNAIVDFAIKETNTLVRREAVSSIGRMRSKRAIPVLRNFLEDMDAKVVLQAIRALLPFKHLKQVKNALKNLAGHPNELIQGAINKEINLARSKKDIKHTISPGFLKNTLVQGDVREVLKCVPDESIHLTFTSPPYYNAKDYTIYKSYDEYLKFLVDIFKLVHRVTKEGRFFVLNTSPVIIPRMSRAHSSKRYLIPFDIHPLLTRIGWEFIEDIIWVKPAPSAKNRNGGFFQHRKPLGYKANSVSEYVIVYRKRTDKLIDWNMRQYADEIIEESKVQGDYAKTNVWKIAPSNDKVHPATFPKELASRIIQFYSFKHDLVFDPFAGTGTVGVIAQMLGRCFFLAEQEKEYIDRATVLLSKQSLLSDCPLKVHSLDDFKSHAEGTCPQ